MLRSKKQEAGNHIKASVGSKVFDAVNVTLLVLLALTTFYPCLLYTSRDQLLEDIEPLKKNQYGHYLMDVLAGKYIDIK